jgi:hypothetical protein
MQTHIKTTKLNFLLNILISGSIGFYIGFWKMNSLANNIDYYLLIPGVIIFHHFFRAGEYILTKKTISIIPRLIDGYEEVGKKARGTFIYYLVTATLLSVLILYLSHFYK